MNRPAAGFRAADCGTGDLVAGASLVPEIGVTRLGFFLLEKTLPTTAKGD
jgi:hypothetical protein